MSRSIIVRPGSVLRAVQGQATPVALGERFSPKLHVLDSLPVGQAVALLNAHDEVLLVPYAGEVVPAKASPLGLSRPHVAVAHELWLPQFNRETR